VRKSFRNPLKASSRLKVHRDFARDKTLQRTSNREGVMEHSTMLSIKDFSNFTGISESTLRYYDKIGLLSPSRRGENRYRYYLPFQIVTVNFIKVLIKLGVPLSVIKKMNRRRTPQDILALLAQQENKLDMRLQELQTAYSIIHTYRDNIQAGIFAHESDIRVRELDAAHIILGELTDFSGSRAFYAPFMEFCSTAHERNIDLNYPIGGYYADVDAFLDAPSQPTRFFSLDPRGKSRRSAGQYLVAYNRGYYGEFGDLPQRMVSYVQANALVFRGPLFIIYLLDEISIADHSQYLSQIMVGVAEK
jgi:DNA-binding transcriptional MerR regulator